MRDHADDRMPDSGADASADQQLKGMQRLRGFAGMRTRIMQCGRSDPVGMSADRCPVALSSSCGFPPVVRLAQHARRQVNNGDGEEKQSACAGEQNPDFWRQIEGHEPFLFDIGRVPSSDPDPCGLFLKRAGFFPREKPGKGFKDRQWDRNMCFTRRRVIGGRSPRVARPWSSGPGDKLLYRTNARSPINPRKLVSRPAYRMWPVRFAETAC